MSKFSEIDKGTSPCFFWGKLNNPYELSRCLITLSNTVQSSFNLSPFQLALLKDPIVTTGNHQIRFEGFSHCAGVYARVDVLEDGQDGEFIESGTTNVDFNTPLISALGKIKRGDKLILSVGQKEVGFHKEGASFIERKVPLPNKWIKELTTVQHYFSASDYVQTLNRIQAIQLFKTIPTGKVKTDYYLIKRGNKYLFSPLKAVNAVCIGGIHRLKLLQPLLPLINELKVYSHKNMQSVTFILCFNALHFVFSISRDFWRSFSGEGAALEDLIEDLPSALIQAFDNYSYTNQVFNPAAMSLDVGIDISKIEKLSTKLAAMGYPSMFLSHVIHNNLHESTFSNESSKKNMINLLKGLYEIWYRADYKESTYLFLATGLLCSDKVARELAAEIWIKAISLKNNHNFG